MDQGKSPILVALLVLLLGNPTINNILFVQINKLIPAYANVSTILFKAILAGVLFYTINRFI